ncbi:hypothetical protein UFOVP1017_47 [uncultured Caudovirales phage]|uniref:DUF4214 domain-containing protein n=1 Tax=uncultured Caudovirales phage TaxID=2100421 RepID=A0A6J5SVL9_9CAUD|nr:hypothetical protein UFOVP511_47 [uncultured Caudovirales phage]CAB4178540.1 hypothetical protein UFOVP1017_47 [uncultured Caudovirales phage]CAB4188031.1 hypothetical protein UFOVP1168_47 [uncultured Caudovirales phage]CAB4219553.1 hypothetical protein UFOVP1617_5 [uncultured Caudovirales phage]
MGIREAYRTYLGRDASDDEVANWESGAYGYGDNPAAWIEAIRNSGEAQAYAARSQGSGGGGDRGGGGSGDQGGGGGGNQGGGGGGGEAEVGPTPTPDPGPTTNPGAGNTAADETQDPSLRAQIAAAYKTHLLRDASDAEITNWLSGSNGWGKGAAGIGRIIQGIATSGEARAAQSRYATGANAQQPGAANRTDYQNTDWWARQGVSSDQIFDANGQLKPGWENFSGGIRRAPGVANMGNLLGFDNENYRLATLATPTMNSVKYGFAQIANRYPPTPSGLKQLMEDPEFKNRFPKAKLVGHDSIDFGDTLSDGATGVPVGIVDVGASFDKGANTGKGWWWGPVGTGNTSSPTAPTTSTSTGGGGGSTASATARGFTASGGGSPLMNPAATTGPMAMGGGGGMGGYSSGGGYVGSNMGSGITPYNPLANYNPEPYNAPAPFMPPAYEGATPFSRPEYAAAQPFTALTIDEMNADPGYQFRMQQGQQALERSGAAKGVTNTGGNLRDILDYGQQAGSQEYGAAYGRKLNDYTTNEQNRFNTYQTNYANALGAYNQNEANRAGAFDRNVGNAASAYNTNAENAYRQYTTNTAGQNMANQEAEARRSGAYNTNLGAYQTQQQYGLQQQNYALQAQQQAYDQQYRNWVEQYNQGRNNATDTYNRMYGLI